MQPTEIIQDADAKLLSVAVPAAEPALFTHWPRLAHVAREAEYAYQRRFGADTWAARRGVMAPRVAGTVGECGASVYRNAHLNRADLRINGYAAGALDLRVALTLDPDALRELARCLIDAAADIEAHPAPAEGGAQ